MAEITRSTKIEINLNYRAFGGTNTLKRKYLELTREVYLEPHEVCEFARKCREDCPGKDPARNTRLSCGLRRGLLLMKETERSDRK